MVIKKKKKKNKSKVIFSLWYSGKSFEVSPDQSLNCLLVVGVIGCQPTPWTDGPVSERETEGFPGGPGVKNLPANAGDTGSISSPRGSHIRREQLNLFTTTIEPVLWSPGTTREATAMRSLSTATREKPTQQRRPSTARIHK